MANYRVSDTELTSVANAIRTKGGTSADLSFPDGFVSAIGNIPTGGGSTLITKSISANGTYAASSENADGYSSVTVAVPNRLVIGTFTGTTTGAAMDVSIPYVGSGFPIAGVIFPTEGSFKSGSTIAELIQNFAIYYYSFSKNDLSATPTYDSNTSENQAEVVLMCKYGTAATGTTDSKSHSGQLYTTTNAGSGGWSSLRIKDATTLSIFIASSSYGFKEGVEYTYYIIYSS